MLISSSLVNGRRLFGGERGSHRVLSEFKFTLDTGRGYLFKRSQVVFDINFENVYGVQVGMYFVCLWVQTFKQIVFDVELTMVLFSTWGTAGFNNDQVFTLGLAEKRRDWLLFT